MTTDTTYADQTATLDQGHTAGPDPGQVQRFAGELLGALSAGSTALMTSVGHRTGLFDAMAGLPPSTSAQVAATAGLHERYVREWLGAMTTARVVVHDPTDDTYRLPEEHAAVLTRASGPDNLAAVMQFLPLMAEVEEEVVGCFAEGGGVPYDRFGRFHEVMAELSADTNDAALLERIVPLVPELPDRLAQGIRVADIGCGQGHAVNLLARAYPDSDFVGYDFSEDALAVARAEAQEWGLANARFELRDVTSLAGSGTFGLVTAFDAVHDQAHPATVLEQVAEHLDPDGVFLMVDMHASSDVDKNMDLPWAPYLYAVSTMHCMTVSLSLDGDGLGTAWGTELARQMLADAGFGDVRVERLEEDFINSYYIARR
ncbi:class I SAM-dependent methyltransferase [Ornithinimicrobium sediminis]|uniref:class I SAM-dependent methyltransferase n=1 Tax=Ornithinimicrobium sediminis TaxID=2904603 RepID=UPI001E607251|nr:class I SAM-dependent methyltransferase [Ornithinimicrobium sediminis]MCE0488312.1 class I SAM-dependent methyltransferase [Ornithinimicrobium sediminis]